MDQSITDRQLPFGKDNHNRGHAMRMLASRIIVLVILTLFSLATFAAEQATPHTEPWPGWHMHGHGFWWIFPLMMFIFIFFFLQILLSK